MFLPHLRLLQHSSNLSFFKGCEGYTANLNYSLIWFENPIQKIDGFHGTHWTHSDSATVEVSKHSTIIITSYVNASRMFDGYQNLSKVMDQPDGPNPDPDAPLKPLYYAEKDFKFPIRIWLYLSFISRFLRHLSLKWWRSRWVVWGQQYVHLSIFLINVKDYFSICYKEKYS